MKTEFTRSHAQTHAAASGMRVLPDPEPPRWSDSEQITLDNLLELGHDELEELYAELVERRPPGAKPA